MGLVARRTRTGTLCWCIPRTMRDATTYRTRAMTRARTSRRSLLCQRAERAGTRAGQIQSVKSHGRGRPRQAGVAELRYGRRRQRRPSQRRAAADGGGHQGAAHPFGWPRRWPRSCRGASISIRAACPGARLIAARRSMRSRCRAPPAPRRYRTCRPPSSRAIPTPIQFLDGLLRRQRPGCHPHAAT